MRNITKKIVCLILGCALIASAVVYVAADENAHRNIIRDHSFIYEILPDGSVTIHCYVGEETDVSVPAYIGENPVRRISPLCFSGTSVKNVTVAEGVTSVDSEAFAYCTNLESVKLPGSIRSLGTGVFRYCSMLESVSLGDGLRCLGDYMFYGCVKLSTVEIPNGITNIPKGAFSYCYNLKQVHLGESLYLIYPYAFYSSGLEKITLPSSLEYIDDYAFSQTYNLTEVNTGGSDTFFVSVTAFIGSAYTPDFTTNPGEHPDSSAVPDDTTSVEEVSTPAPPSATDSSGGDETETPLTTMAPSWNETTTPCIPETTPCIPETTGMIEVETTNPSAGTYDDLIENYTPGSDFTFSNGYNFISNENSVSHSANQAAQNKRQEFAELAWDVRMVGDSNCDGKVNVKDATTIQKYVAEIITDSHPNFNYKNSDVNTDGLVNIRDATKIQKYCAGFINILY